MAVISSALRSKVVERAAGLCEYCQTAQAIVIEMEIDHIIPESAGGETLESNLVLPASVAIRTSVSSRRELIPYQGK